MSARLWKLQIDPAEELRSAPERWYSSSSLGKMGDRELHVVVACADRKRVAAGAPVRLGTIKAGPPAERCAAWWRSLSAAVAETPARELYAGDHWAVGRELPEVARTSGFAPRLWVASAGYGLVPENARLAAYSATFATDSPDTVLSPSESPRESSQAWWRELGKRRLRGHDDPRSLADLAGRAARGATIMVVASPAYVTALEHDLKEAVTAGRGTRLLLITSAPGPQDARLADYWIPTTGNLRMALGGALTSIHARIARRLLEHFDPSTLDAESARRYTQRLAGRTPELPTLDRTRGDDAQVRAFIRSALRRDDDATHTRLLREYRASGHACEQRRFRDLFKEEARGR